MRTLLAFLFVLTTASAQTYEDPKATAYYAEHKDFFHFAKPTDLPAGWTLKMLFEKHFSCSLGHFRLSVTTDEQNVRCE